MNKTFLCLNILVCWGHSYRKWGGVDASFGRNRWQSSIVKDNTRLLEVEMYVTWTMVTLQRWHPDNFDEFTNLAIDDRRYTG